MAKISDMVGATYLRKDDVTDPLIVTISEVKLETVGKDESQEDKYVMYFSELDKGLVLNKTNINIAAKVTGEDDSDNWTGHSIILYFDETVSYAGSVVGGLRLRAPQKAPKAPTKPTPKKTGGSGMDDLMGDVPFDRLRGIA